MNAQQGNAIVILLVIMIFIPSKIREYTFFTLLKFVLSAAGIRILKKQKTSAMNLGAYQLYK